MSRTLRARLRALNTVLSTSTSLRRTARRITPVVVYIATVALLLSVPAAAHAEAGGPVIQAAYDLPVVIANLQAWLMRLLWSVAGLFAAIGGVYRVTAAGDPTRVEKGNAAFKNAAIGAGLAVLAPVLLEIVKDIVGG